MILSLVLSASIFGSLHESLYRDMTDSMDTSVNGEYVQFRGQEIMFQHQMWRVNTKSVCSNYQQYSPEHTQCTTAASEYFNESCRYLSNNPSSERFGKQIQSMLCAASVSFQPTIAEISSPKAKNDLEKLESECNQLIFQASNSDDESIATQRDHVCEKFQKLSNK